MDSHLLKSEFLTDQRLPLKVLPRYPQLPYPTHTHDFSELVLVTGGEGIHFTAEEEYPVGAGDVFVIHGDRAHGYREIQGLTLYNILFDLQILERELEDLRDISGYHALFRWEPRLRTKHRFESRLRLSPGELEHAVFLSEKILKEAEREREGFRLMARTAFLELCGFLSRRYTGSRRPGTADLTRIAGLLTFLEENTDRFITVVEICEMAGLSESTLRRLFLKNTGFSPLEYHKRLRIRRVCEELRHTDRTVTEIAYDLGYQDSNYMTRQFRAVTGHTPLKYRRDPSIPLLAD